MDADDTTRRANQLWFDSGAWQRTTWMGWPVVKCPTDLWAYQELIVATRPDVIIETGSWVGGSALFFAHMLDLVGHGRVISVDVQRVDGRPEHPRITWVLGDSADPATVARVHDLAAGGAALVVLDASHRAAHVLAELRGYADLVPPGGCLVVEDTAFDGWPVWPGFGDGPAAAVAAFLAERHDFVVDPEPTRHLLTLAPGGFLRRVAARG